MSLFDTMVDVAQMNENSRLVHRIELKNGGEILTFEESLSGVVTLGNHLKVKGKTILVRHGIETTKEAKHSAFNLAAMLNEGWEIAANE